MIPGVKPIFRKSYLLIRSKCAILSVVNGSIDINKLYGYTAMTKSEALENILLSGIKNGNFRPGEKIPSRNMLMQKYGLSRETVEKAVGNLVRSGVLLARRGSATTVAPERCRNGNSFSRILFIYPCRMTPPSLRCFEADFEIRSCTCDEFMFHEEKYSAVDTLLIWFYPGYSMLSTINRLEAKGFRQLLINRRFGEVPYVTIDYESGLKAGLQQLKEKCGSDCAVISNDIYQWDEPFHAERLVSFYRAAGTLGICTRENHVFIGNDTGTVRKAVQTLFMPNSPKRGITILSTRLIDPFLLEAAAIGKAPGRDFELLLCDYRAGLELYPGIHMLNQRGYHIMGEYMLQLAASSIKKGELPQQKINLELIK